MYFGNDPKPGDNMTNPIFVENDEYVVNRNAARKFKPMLDTLNFVVEPRFDNEDTAHSAIDEAIAMNFLSEVGMLPAELMGLKSKDFSKIIDSYS